MKISKTERVKIEQQEIEFKKWPGYRSSEIPELRRFVDMHNFYHAVAKNINTPPELLSRMVDGITWIADNKVSHDVRMLVAINPDQGVELEEVSEEMHDLMEELHVNDTSFFGVPDPIQNLWSEFYEEGQRNLLSLSSEEYFCLGTDDTGQVMYKKKRMEKLVFHFIGRIIKRANQ